MEALYLLGALGSALAGVYAVILAMLLAGTQMAVEPRHPRSGVRPAVDDVPQRRGRAGARLLVGGGRLWLVGLALVPPGVFQRDVDLTECPLTTACP